MKDIKWYVSRLKAMSMGEILWRIEQKLQERREYRKYYIMHVPVTEIAVEKELANLKPYVKYLGIQRDNSNFQLFEELDIPGGFSYETYKREWNHGFQTQHRWPDTDYSYKISIGQREDIGDIRTNWELNRHHQFVGLAKNFYITGDDKYFRELKELFEDWNKNNLFLHGVQWVSPMEISIRVISWSYMYAFVEKALFRKANEERVFLKQIENGIKVMASHILKHRSRYSSANNHLVVEMLGVGVAGFLFHYSPWINVSVRILSEELSKQNFEDGINKEMSLHYQAFVMEAYGILCILMRNNQIPIPSFWKKTLSRMSEYVADCCGDFGEVMIFGDNDEGKILDFHGRINNYYQYVLQLMGSILDFRYTDTQTVEALGWLITNKQFDEYWKKARYYPSLIRSYKEGGVTVLRGKNHKILIGFDHGKLGFGKMAAHGHADALSIQVFFEGNPVLVDGGTFNYHTPKSIRNEMRKTLAHNTVYVKGKEQAEMLGPFLWGRRYKNQYYNCLWDDEKVVVSSAVSYEGIIHKRELVFNYDNELLVTDEVTSKADCYQVWNTADNIIIEEENSEQKGIYINFFSTATNRENKEYEYSVKYGEKMSGRQYRFKIENNKIETAIRISRKETEQRTDENCTYKNVK